MNYAFPEAQAQYETAIDLWDQVPDAEERAGQDRVDVLARLAGVARFHEPSRAVAHIQAAIALVDESVDPVRSALLHERLGRYAWTAGQGDLARDGYQTAMRLTPAEPPSEARARAVAGLAQILMLGARFEESKPLAEEAVAIARAVGAVDIEGHALNTRGLDRAIAGEVDAGLDDMREAMSIAERAGIIDDIGRAYANEVWILMSRAGWTKRSTSPRRESPRANGSVSCASSGRISCVGRPTTSIDSVGGTRAS